MPGESANRTIGSEAVTELRDCGRLRVVSAEAEDEVEVVGEAITA
jgi:hypothetical protein